MPRFDAMLTIAEELSLAVRAYAPTHVARHFAAHVGQFYRRGDFDALAREASALYATRDGEEAHLFRLRLDRRLRDRHHAPVRWDVTTPEVADDRAA